MEISVIMHTPALFRAALWGKMRAQIAVPGMESHAFIFCAHPKAFANLWADPERRDLSELGD